MYENRRCRIIGRGLARLFRRCPALFPGTADGDFGRCLRRAPAQIRLGAADETKSIVELAEYQVGRWIRISTVLTPTGMRNFQIYNNTAGAIVYFRNAKVEFSSSPTLYTPQAQDNIWHADLEFPCGNNEFAEDDQFFFVQKNPATGSTIRQYWKLVTAAGEDWIEFSSTDSEGTGEPSRATGSPSSVIAAMSNASRP